MVQWLHFTGEVNKAKLLVKFPQDFVYQKIIQICIFFDGVSYEERIGWRF